MNYQIIVQKMVPSLSLPAEVLLALHCYHLIAQLQWQVFSILFTVHYVGIGRVQVEDVEENFLHLLY